MHFTEAFCQFFTLSFSLFLNYKIIKLKIRGTYIKDLILSLTEMWLKPRYDNYGPEYASGCVLLGLARGNDNLINVTTKAIYDSRRLDFGLRTGTTRDLESHMISKIQDNGPKWAKGFHVYTTIWNSDGFQFFVDGDKVGTLTPSTTGWLNDVRFDKMAPFDQEV